METIVRSQKGFSIIELLVVVAIILVIAAVAIPNLLRSKVAANEASAVGSLRSISTAQVTYFSSINLTNQGGSYAIMLGTLGPGPTGSCPSTGATLTNACLLDGILAASSPGGGVGSPNQKDGYNFYLTALSSGPLYTAYASGADPISQGQSGTRYFYSDTTAVIRYNMTAPASVTDQPLQ
jgi:prepilin-type N-terminal cleavage/methylation domain-containing protein